MEETQKIPPLVPDLAHPGSEWKRRLLRRGVIVLSQIAASKWMKNKAGQGNDIDFPLPSYASFKGFWNEKELN